MAFVVNSRGQELRELHEAAFARRLDGRVAVGPSFDERQTGSLRASARRRTITTPGWNECWDEAERTSCNFLGGVSAEMFAPEHLARGWLQ
jgi:hypothetical protein